jgi:outer membrane protein assembly factor BamB
MLKNFLSKIKCVNYFFLSIALILSGAMVTSIKNFENVSQHRLFDNFSSEPLWIYDSDLYIKHVEVAQLNDNGPLDVIAAEYDSDNYGDPSVVYGINGLNGNKLWSYTLNDGARSMTIEDINNDGVMDAVIGASKSSSTPDGKVHAIDGTDGTQIWTFTPGTSGDTNGDVAIGNFDGDEYPDVAVACWDDYVYAINGSNGNQIWRTYIGSIFVFAVDTGDVNGDNIDDVAYGHSYLSGWDNYFGVLDGKDGSVIWNMTVKDPIVEGGVLLDDIDDDGDLEAIFGNRTGYVAVRNASNGNLEWEYDTGPVGSPTNFDMYLFSYDIDDDNDLDLIIGNDYGSYYVFAFDGNKSKPMWISEKLDGYPKDIAFGDVSGDGNLNIIAATYDRVQILEAKNGSKLWYYSVAGTIATVGCADFDNNSVFDVLAGGGAEFTGSNPAKSIWALKTIQSPILWEFDFGEYGNALAIDNLNGDTYMDVVAVCSVNDKAWAISGNDGTELWNWTGTENLYAVTTGDFDDDGQIDVAVGGNDDRVTALYGNNGTIMWQFTSTGNQIYRKCLQATDLNNDNNIDVIAGCDDSNIYAINGSNGNQLWSCYVGAAINEIELAQMNNSGPLDIVAAVGAGSNGEKVTIIDGVNGKILWSYNAPEAVEHVELLDVNNDTIPDVAAAITPFTPMQIIMIDGLNHTLLWTKSISIASNVHSLAHGDLNEDSIPDLIVPGRSTDKKVYALNGKNGDELWSYMTGGEINTVFVEDMNSDNSLDVIAGSDDQNVYALYGNNGSCFWNFSTAGDVMHIQTGDISGDGTPNIGCVTFDSDGIVYAFKPLSETKNYPPYKPRNPSPTNGALYVDPNADLSWKGGDPNPKDIVTYDIYFDTNSIPSKIVSNQTSTSYKPGTMKLNTTYYWKIIAWDNNNASTKGPTWKFTTEGPNHPPNKPDDPDPADDETDVDVDSNLLWTGGDPDPGDSVLYDVYFSSKMTPSKVASNQSSTTYDPGRMKFNTTYYWKIIAWDNHNVSTKGEVWNFTTRDNKAPTVPKDPDPPDGKTGVDINADISWNCTDPDGDDLTFDVYFEANDSTPDILVSTNQSESWYDPGKMNYNTHYYWQIVAWDEYGKSTTGPVWDFTTGIIPNNPPYQPSNPTPENGSVNVFIDITLSWLGGDPDPEDIVVYDVYFEANDSTPDILVSDDQLETLYSPDTLDFNIIYYWRIISKDNHGASTPGPIWHFTTQENTPPSAPTIQGETSGKKEKQYEYSFNAIDPEDHPVRYFVDWGDNLSEWTEYTQSGIDMNVNHTWSNKGTYTITARAEDIYGALGLEATLEITMPKNTGLSLVISKKVSSDLMTFPLKQIR